MRSDHRLPLDIAESNPLVLVKQDIAIFSCFLNPLLVPGSLTHLLTVAFPHGLDFESRVAKRLGDPIDAEAAVEEEPRRRSGGRFQWPR